MKIGERIRRAVETCSDWQHGGNTSLGAILLLVPIAYAAGMVPLDSPMQAPAVRKNLRKVVRGTTASDTVNAYRAISQASPGGLGRVPELDVNDPTSIAEIRKRGIFLRDIFRISARYDLISREWVSDFHVTFEIGLPFLRQELRATGDINSAIVDTYLKILSQMPDTLVARKSGMGAAKQISIRAKRVLEVGAMRTKRGRRAVEQMDKLIQRLGHCYNPGTTADLTASSASVLVLEGFRP
jgi:triphosphoribosyl-dephospho-CoA synthase